MVFNKKGGAGELLLELLLATVIFFIVVLFIFAFDAGRLDMKIKATVLTADSSYQCSESLSSLIKARVDYEGHYIPYGDYILAKYAEGDYESAIGKGFDIFSKVYSEYSLSLSTADKGELFKNIRPDEFEEIDDRINCSMYLPLPIKEREDCYFAVDDFIVNNEEEIDKETPDGKIGFSVQNLVVDESSDESKTAEICLHFDDTSIIVKADVSSLSGILDPSALIEKPHCGEDTPDLDEFTVPIRLENEETGETRYYGVRVREIGSENSQQAEISIARRLSIEDCSVIVTLGLVGYKREKEGIVLGTTMEGRAFNNLKEAIRNVCKYKESTGTSFDFSKNFKLEGEEKVTGKDEEGNDIKKYYIYLKDKKNNDAEIMKEEITCKINEFVIEAETEQEVIGVSIIHKGGNEIEVKKV